MATRPSWILWAIITMPFAALAGSLPWPPRLSWSFGSRKKTQQRQPEAFSHHSEVVASGCSVGAVAAALHIDAAKRLLLHGMVVPSLDSEAFPDWTRADDDHQPRLPAGVLPLDRELGHGFERRDLAAAGALPPQCILVEWLHHFCEMPSVGEMPPRDGCSNFDDCVGNICGLRGKCIDLVFVP